MTRLVCSPATQDSLLARGRASRPPLRPWAHALLERLESGEASTADRSSLAACLDDAARIETFRGNCRGAWRLCELQLRCAEDRPELAARPWIHLGRLWRWQGQSERALEHFALLLEVMRGGAPRHWPLAAPPSAEALPWLESVYLVDSTKTYLRARDPEGALRFLHQARALLDDGEAHPLLDEAELITFAQLGRYEDALALTERPGWQQDGYGMLVRLTYRGALLSALGAEDSARPLASRLAERVLAMNWSHPKDPRQLRYLLYLGRLTREVGLEEASARLGHMGLRAAHQFGDVPLRLAFLESLLDLPDVAERAALAAERSALLAECLYVPLLVSRGLTVDPLALEDPVFARLHHQLESVVAHLAGPAAARFTAA